MKLTESKASILYSIFTMLCLEAVRRRYKKLEQRQKLCVWTKHKAQRKKNNLLFGAALLYGLVLFLLPLSFLVSLVRNIAGTFPGITFLRSNFVFFLIAALSYAVSVIIVRTILEQYIKVMNTWDAFWLALKRSPEKGADIVHRTGAALGRGMRKAVCKSRNIFGMSKN